jgi:hypothetical protein
LRKVAAILLLLILAFNWFGYRILTNYLQHKADRQLEAKLDVEDYDSSQLIELKVPVSLPYQSNWDDFERYDGEIEVNGIHYKYVKRKVYNDSLILLCLPNEDKMKIENAKDNFFKLVNDLQTASSQKGSSKSENLSFKNLITEYWFNQNSWGLASLLMQPAEYCSNNTPLQNLFNKEVSEKPPNC